MLQRIWIPTLFAPLALAAMAGFTNCGDFDDVTIPASDTTDPTMASRIYMGGTETIAMDHYHHETDDIDTSFQVLPCMIDAGGAHRLSFHQSLWVACKDPVTGEPTEGYIADFVTESDHQDGDVGDTVSNGIYLVGESIHFSDYGCNVNAVDFIQYQWSFLGEDFAGNQASSGGEIVYRDRGTCGCDPGGFGNICLPAYNGCTDGYAPHCDPVQGSCGGCECE